MAGIRARLGRAARAAREDAGISLGRMAAETGRSDSTLSRFENGRRWPDRLDELVAAYERECGLRPLDLWRRAVEDRPDQT